jgi:hypothetical protein
VSVLTIYVIPIIVLKGVNGFMEKAALILMGIEDFGVMSAIRLNKPNLIQADYPD